MKKIAIVLGSAVVLAGAVFSTTYVMAGDEIETQEISVEDCNPENCKKVCKEQCAKHCTAADIKNCQKVCSSKSE